MIAWLFLIGVLFIALTLPARIFGWLCGCIVLAAIRSRKPPNPPPI